MSSGITDSLRNAYSATEFVVVDVHAPFVLRIGRASERLAELYAQFGVDCAAFITAFNPYSEAATDEQNEEKQSELLHDLSDMGLACINGRGEDPGGAWPSETSVLVLGISKADAELIGMKYRQNAIVWIGADCVPELVFLV